MPQIVPLIFPFAVLAVCALSDIQSFKIPNRYVALLLIGWPVTVLLTGQPLDDAALSAAFGGGALLLGFVLFALGAFGAGDAKLIAAVTPWVPVSQLPSFVIFTVLLGGAIALFLFKARQLPLPARAYNVDWIAQMYDRKRVMPYGVAIAGGAMIAMARGIPVA